MPQRLFLLLSVYALMLLRWGYEFGRNDQMQTLAYAEMLADPGLYPHDFYLQGIHERVPNERFVFSRLLSLGAGHLHAVSLIGHLVFSLLLLHFMERIASRYIRHEALRWVGLLLLFVPLYGVNLGGNELWYNSFFVSNVVKTMGMAALWYLLQGHTWRVLALAAGITLLQPVVGLQVYGLSSAALLLGLVGEGRRSDRRAWRKWLGANALWWLSGGLWVYFLHSHFEQEPLSGPDHFFEILFVFRAPHHYWPPSWALKDWLIEGGLLLAGLAYFFRREPLLRNWLLLTVLACGLWTLGVVGLHSTELAALQGFKTTLWAEYLGVLALLALVQDFFGWTSLPAWKRLWKGGLLGLGASAVLVLALAGHRLPHPVPWDVQPGDRRDAALDICARIREKTPEDALFVHPIAFTELKFHGLRSSYVDYKVLVHTRAAMHRWQERIALLYGVSWDGHASASDRYTYANAFYRQLEPAVWHSLQAQGVTHVLTFADALTDQQRQALGWSEVARNAQWAVYALQPK